MIFLDKDYYVTLVWGNIISHFNMVSKSITIYFQIIKGVDICKCNFSVVV